MVVARSWQKDIILSNAEGDCLKSPLAWVILIDFDDRTSRRPDVRSFPPSAIRTANFSAEKNFGRKMFVRIFSWGGLGERSRSNHFKKFAKANFLKWCRGGVWGGLPPQETPLPVPCPPGGSGGLRPPRISVTRALPPQLDVRTVKNLKMSPKGRTDLKI